MDYGGASPKAPAVGSRDDKSWVAANNSAHEFFAKNVPFRLVLLNGFSDNSRPLAAKADCVMVAVSVLSQRYAVNPARPGREQR